MATIEATTPTGRSRTVLVKEVLAFGLVGGVGFALDLAVYQAMYGLLGVGALTSKIISTALTSTVAYFLHRHISFAHRARSAAHRELTLFLVLSAVSLGLGLLLIGTVRYGLGEDDVAVLQIANVCAIAGGAVFRYFAYKRWVFLPEATAPSAAPTDQA